MKVYGLNVGLLVKTLGIVLTFSAASCSSKPQKPGSAIAGQGQDGGGSGGGGANADFPVSVSLQAFKQHVYDPIVQPNCANCHHTQNLTLEESHAYMLGSILSGDANDTGLIVFKAPKQSVLYKRIEANHNCTSDNCKGDIVEAAISNWAKDIEGSGFQIGFPEYSNQTSETALSGAKPVNIAINANEYAYASASDATGTGTLATVQSGAGDGKLDQYFASPFLGDNNALAQGDANAGTVEFTVDVAQAGTYFLWARMNVPADTQNQMFFIVEQGGQQVFNTAEPAFEPSGEEWVWNQVQDQNGNGDDGENGAAIQLDAGPVTIRAQESTGGVKVSYVFLTTRDDANREQFITQYYDIAVDISEVSGVAGSKMVATIWKQDSGDEGAQSVGVLGLRVESPKPLKIKGIMPVINKIFDPSHSTFTLVDVVAGGTDPSKQVIDTGGASSSTWIADFSKDTLGFAFNEIGPAE